MFNESVGNSKNDNKKFCLIDPSHVTIRKSNGRPTFGKYKDGWLCARCYARIVRNPQRTREYIKKYNDRQTYEYRKKYNDKKTPQKIKKYNDLNKPKRIRFGNGRLFLSFIVRKGVCEWCGRKNGDRYVTKKGKESMIITHRHHWFYLRIMPWSCTVEICNSCHARTD